MLDAFQDAGFALRGPGKSVAVFGPSSAGVRVNAHAAGDTGGGVSRREVLPVLAFPDELTEFVVADPATTAWRTDPGLFDGPQNGPGRCGLQWTTPAKP